VQSFKGVVVVAQDCFMEYFNYRYFTPTYKGVSGCEVKDGLDIARVDVLFIILLDLLCNTCINYTSLTSGLDKNAYCA